jgi:acetyl esterase/lipase
VFAQLYPSASRRLPGSVTQTCAMRTVAAVCAGLVMVAMAGCGSSSTPTATPVATFPAATTVTYCTDGGEALTLDVLEPATGAAPHPALVVVHGGSWAFGISLMSTQNPLTQEAAAALLRGGFVVVSINYRLAPRDVWPAQIIDTRCAIRYLRASAGRWGIDPQRLVALGNSAGAQLVSLDALSIGQEPQWDNGQYASESSGVQGVVDLWGPIDLTAAGWGPAAIQIGTVVFRDSLGSDSDALRRASPVIYVRAGAPPFLIIQGLADTLVPPAQAAELQQRLLAAGDTARLVDVAHAAHELRPVGGAVSPSIAALATQVVSFVTGTA